MTETEAYEIDYERSEENTFAFHLKRMWPKRHDSEADREAVRANLRGQRAKREWQAKYDWKEKLDD